MLYKYCSQRSIPHKQIGKLIVATRASEVQMLNRLMNRGIQNGVAGLELMEGKEAMRMEPQLQCTSALLSPVSGILDAHSLMLSMVVCTSLSSSFALLNLKHISLVALLWS